MAAASIAGIQCLKGSEAGKCVRSYLADLIAIDVSVQEYEKYYRVQSIYTVHIIIIFNIIDVIVNILQSNE